MAKLYTIFMFLCILHFMSVLSKSITQNVENDELLNNYRPKINPETDELMDAEQSNIVFRPLFTYKHQQANRRRVRSTGTDATNDKNYKNIEQNSELDMKNEGEDMDADESSVVFRPLFVYRRQQEARRRIQNQNAQRRSGNIQYPYNGHQFGHHANCHH